MTFKVKILQFLVDTRKTRTQDSLYPMQITMFFRFIIRFHRIFTDIGQ